MYATLHILFKYDYYAPQVSIKTFSVMYVTNIRLCWKLATQLMISLCITSCFGDHILSLSLPLSLSLRCTPGNWFACSVQTYRLHRTCI